MKSLADKLLGAAVMAVTAVWLLHVAWQLLRPLLPGLIVLGTLVLFARWQRR